MVLKFGNFIIYISTLLIKFNIILSVNHIAFIFAITTLLHSYYFVTMTYCLGIDIGTTSIKIGLFDYSTNKVILFATRDHDAAILFPSEPNSSFKKEQSTIKIFNTLNTLLNSLDFTLSARICRIVVCGQMHGVVLWSNSFSEYALISEKSVNKFSNLITWEDRRCTLDFLKFLPQTENTMMKTHPGV